MLFTGAVIGAILDRLYLDTTGQLKGPHLATVGPEPYRIPPGVVSVTIEVYGVGGGPSPKCIEIEGEKGRGGAGYAGGQGGDGGKGLICGGAVAILPGHGGEPPPNERL